MRKRRFLLAFAAFPSVVDAATTIDFEALLHNDAEIVEHGTSHSEDGFSLTALSPNTFGFGTYGTRESRFSGSTALMNNTASPRHQFDNFVLASGSGTWLNSAGGDWQSAANWSGGAIPTGSDDISFNLNSPTSYTVNLSAAGAANSLTVGNDKVTLALGAQTLTVGAQGEYVTVAQAGQNGQLGITGTTGTLDAHSINVAYGVGATGSVTQDSGNVDAYFVSVGVLGGRGSYTLTGTGALTANVFVGESGTGTFTQTGGSLVGEVLVGYYGHTGDDGTFNLSGGAVQAPVVHVGLGSSGGVGVLNISGGSLTTPNYVHIWDSGALSPGGTRVNLTGGTLTAGTIEGPGATTRFNWTDGNLTLTNTPAATVRTGSYLGSNLQLTATKQFSTNGSLTIATTGTASVTQTGGTSAIGTNLMLGTGAGSSGTYNLSAGTMTAGGMIAVGGSDTVAGATGTLNISGTGSLTTPGVLKIWNTGGTPGTRVNLSGGHLTIDSLDYTSNPARFNWTGGTLELTTQLVTLGNVSAASSFLGSDSLTIGANKTLITPRVEVGNQRQGTLTVNNGGRIETALMLLGARSDGLGSATVTGATSSASIDTLRVGNSPGAGGNTSFTASAGADVDSIQVEVRGQTAVAGTGGSLTIDNSAWHNAGNFYVGGSAAGATGLGKLTVANNAILTVDGELRAYNDAINGTTAATFIRLQGGTISAGSLNIGGNPGRFDWQGGTLEITASDVLIGQSSTPANTFGNNNYTIGSGRSLIVSGAANRLVVGNTFPGTLTVLGSVVTPKLQIGEALATSGTPYVNVFGSSSLVAPVIEVGKSNAEGTLHVQNGANVTAETLITLYTGFGTERLIVHEATLTAREIDVRSSAGFVANGTLKPTADNTNWIHGVTDGLELLVGSFPAGLHIDTAGFNVASQIPITRPVSAQSDGGLTKSGAGELTVHGVSTYKGPTNVTGGTLVMPQGLKSGGALTIADGAKAVVPAASPSAYDPGNNIFPTGDNATGSKVNALNINGSGQLDLGNSDLAIDHNGSSPLADVAAMIASGYNGGSWDGPGVVASTALLDPSVFGLGYAENSELPDPYGTGVNAFFGIDVDSTSVLVKFTWIGDLNLDGFVNFSDLLTFNGTFDDGATTGRFWFEGDFDYDGTVSFSDLLLFNGAYDENKTSLPEPAGMGALILSAWGLSRGSRRRRGPVLRSCRTS